MKNLGDEILRHLYETHNDFAQYRINEFLSDYQPKPTDEEINRAISFYERSNPKLLYSDGQHQLLGQNKSISLVNETGTLDNLIIVVAMTNDGKKYIEEKIAREQPTIIHKSVSVGDVSGGQVVVDSTTRDITNNPIATPTVKHTETHIHKLNKR